MFINQQRQKMDEKYYLSTRAALINAIQDFLGESALLHKDLKGKAPLIEPNLRRNLGKWST